MPSTFSTNLKIELMSTGENSGTWGTVTNTNLGTALEQAVVGYGNPNYSSDANLTITLTDSNAAQAARALVLNVTSSVSLTGTRELVVPTIQKQYIVQNNTTGSQSITVKTSAGTGVTIPNGKKMHVYVNGTDVVQMDDFALIFNVDNLTLDGNTLSSTNTNGNIVIAPNGTGDVQLDADTIRVGDSNTNVTITSNGTGDLILNTNAGTNSGSITIEDGVNGNIIIAPNGTGQVQITNAALDLTTIEVSNINAKDGTAAITIADSTGAVGISTAVTMSATTQNIALGTSQTTGTFTVGGAAQTGALTLDQSTKTHTLNLGTGATESGLTKTVNIGTAGVSGSTTAITVGSANGTTTTLNGTVTAATLNSTTIDTTNIEVTNIKAKDGTAALSIADSTGAVTVATALTANGGAVFNENGADVDFRVEGDTDANLIFADASTDRVGIGTNTPTNLLTVSGTGSTPVAVVRTSSTVNAATYLAFQAYNASSAAVTYASLGSIITTNTAGAQSGALAFNTVSAAAVTERMRLTADGQLNLGGNFTSTNNTLQVTGNAAIGYTTAAPTTGLIVAGNVGVGTDSPNFRLHVAGPIGATSSFSANQTATAGFDYQSATNNSRFFSWGPVGTVGGFTWFQGSGGNAATNTMTLDSSGNLGLGVTPSAWSGIGKTLQVNTGGSFSADTANAYFAANSYYNGTNWIYQTTNNATRYTMASNSHLWYTAPSGTAGNAITFNQAMTLDASGNLGLGQTSIAAVGNYTVLNIRGRSNLNGGLIRLETLDGTSGVMRIYQGENDGNIEVLTNDPLIFSTNSTERARITSVGGFETRPAATGHAVFNEDGVDADFRVESDGNTNMLFLNGGDNRVTIGSDVGNHVFNVYSATLGSPSGAMAIIAQLNGSGEGLFIDAATRTTADNAVNLVRVRNRASEDVFNITVAGTVIVNESGGDIDFRVESDNDTHCLFVDASTDRVGIGTNAPGYKVDIANASSFTGLRLIRTNNSSQLTFTVQSSTAIIESTGTGSNTLAFNTEGNERARITSGGYFKASNDGTYFNSTGTYHELRQTANAQVVTVSATNASFTSESIFSTATKTAGTDWMHFYGTSDGNTVANIKIFGNGNVQNANNSYAGISDQKLKQDIVDAGSQWDDIKNLQVRKYRFKASPNAPLQIGLVAQEAETVSPGLVEETVDRDSEGNDLGTTTKAVKYSVLYMKAIKALQEAMARIEKLEAEVAALKGV